ncbi:MAG: hypothetical protein MI923_30415 [Phycisphaerales bacterium]|nr:hypothetical protein [Phycisphaerales bacterium]
MRKYKLVRKTLVGMSMLLAGGTVLANGCINTVASLPICGGVVQFCTPDDQLLLFLPVLEFPDFNVDPACTIPGACGDAGSFDNGPGGIFPGGGDPDPPDDPEDPFTGGGGGGGGGVGGGI